MNLNIYLKKYFKKLWGKNEEPKIPHCRNSSKFQ